MITFNHAPYIAKAIESILAQKTNFVFELVIGEDCSTDGTRQIVAEYAQRFSGKVRIITSENNVGMHENSNRVYASLHGKYIAWCEGDDFWQRDDKLQQQVDYLESNQDCGLVCSDYDQYDTKTRVTTQYALRAHGKYIAQCPGIESILAGNGGVLTCTAVARREIVERVRAEDFFLHQSGHFKMGDTQLWAELSLNYRIYRFDESFATRNLLTESATQSGDKNKVLRFWISNSEMCLYLCDKHKLAKKIRNSHLEIIRRKTLQLAFYEDNIGLAMSLKNTHSISGIKNLIWYFGTRYKTVRLVLSHVLELKNMRVR